ncbi:MAG: iron-sulfur cluster co-chaperone HscB C-terminal domain-containing protein [Chitinophagaceae bacterium]|jgi:molecular chaperone HscB
MENYFELYEMPQTFYPDAAAIKQKFYALSKQFHPDRFAQADESAKEDALRKAAMNNEAYKILGDADKTMAYILHINNVLEEEEKYNLPPEFLMEMMELNESVSDYEDDPENTLFKNQAEQELAAQLDSWNRELAPLVDAFEKEGPDKELLIRIKDFYFRKKYLLRIRERLTTFASR